MKKYNIFEKVNYFIIALSILSILLLTGCNFKHEADSDMTKIANNVLSESAQENGTETLTNEWNIFENAEDIESGGFYERSENQFDNSIYYQIDAEDCDAICKALLEASGTEETVSFDKDTYRYQMYLYDGSGEELYWLFVDAEGNVVYDGKKLDADKLMEWIDGTVLRQH